MKIYCIQDNSRNIYSIRSCILVDHKSGYFLRANANEKTQSVARV